MCGNRGKHYKPFQLTAITPAIALWKFLRRDGKTQHASTSINTFESFHRRSTTQITSSLGNLSLTLTERVE